MAFKERPATTVCPSAGFPSLIMFEFTDNSSLCLTGLENMKLLEAWSKPASGQRPLAQVNATHPNFKAVCPAGPWHRALWGVQSSEGHLGALQKRGSMCLLNIKYRGIWWLQFCSAHNLLASKESNSRLKTAGRAYVLSDERDTSVWPPSPTPHRCSYPEGRDGCHGHGPLAISCFFLFWWAECCCSSAVSADQLARNCMHAVCWGVSRSPQVSQQPYLC